VPARVPGLPVSGLSGLHHPQLWGQIPRTKAPLLLAGDLTYGAGILERRQIPGVGSRHDLAVTTDKVLALKEQMPDLVVLPAHDPTAARRLLES
jgi:hypothetical protein